MSGLTWPRWVLTAACVLVAGYRLVHATGAGRGSAARPARPRRDGSVAAAHAAMELGMAAMFSPALSPIPPATWVLVSGAFAAGTLIVPGRRGAAGRASGPGSIAGARDRAYLAMVSVSMVFAVGDGSAGPSSTHRHAATARGAPILAWLLASYFVVYAVLSATRWSAARRGAVRPALLTGCDVATSAAMAYMLLA